ncbi:hypothetical protein [Pengzhenrongella sicca]|uniref:Uncharacterized protein n=1 Tax=Pengzhenrongella sicca TaxID=2819238 RepID=A0A8A4Z9C5_9MICO|nr:hypothetical protein [Pengzhenrongella sicca]QTE28454.1 hypothetical protein J4E96_13865 [Pengzhenrongella sicca]
MDLAYPMRPVSPDMYVGPTPYQFRWWADLAPVALGFLVAIIFPDVPIPVVLGAMVIVWFVYWLTVTLRARRARARTLITE